MDRYGKQKKFGTVGKGSTGTIGGHSTLHGGAAGSTCAEQCVNFWQGRMSACADSTIGSCTAPGTACGAHCPSYCEASQYCSDCHSFQTGECDVCLQWIWTCKAGDELQDGLQDCLENCGGAYGGPHADPSPKDWRRGGSIKPRRRRRRR